MYKTIATLAIVAFIQISDAAVPGAVDLRSMLSLGDPSFEIRSGNCRNATMATLVYQDHVHKSRLPFSTREAKVSLYEKRQFNSLYYSVIHITEILK
nr:unnamed protein product [Callosobruchus analis]